MQTANDLTSGSITHMLTTALAGGRTPSTASSFGLDPVGHALDRGVLGSSLTPVT